MTRGDCCSNSRSNGEFVSKEVAVRTYKGRDLEDNIEVEFMGLVDQDGVGGRVEETRVNSQSYDLASLENCEATQ